MYKDALCRQMKKMRERLRWAGLSSDPDFVQLCHEMVDYNAKRIEKVLKSITDCKLASDYLAEYKEDYFPKESDNSLTLVQDFRLFSQDLMCHFCECVDIQ